MPRPTRDELRQLLDDLGLDSVDPTSFFSSTSPELLRLMIDAGPMKPLPTFSFLQTNTFTSGVNITETFDITGANANTIRVIKNMTIQIDTAGIEEVELQHFDGTVTVRLWLDEQPGAIPPGPYIGSDNLATRAWGAQGLSNIVLYPPELTTNPNNQRQLQIRIESAAAQVKTIVLNMSIVEFDSRLFPGGLW